MTEYYLIFDDTCPVCRTGVDHVRRLDQSGLIRPVPLSRPELPAGMVLPPKDELTREIHLINARGKVWRGAAAVAEVARLYPKTRFWGWLMDLPGIRWVAAKVYRLVARYRHRL